MRWSAFALALLVPISALAQGKPPKPKPQTFTLTKQTHTGAEDVARARFAAGDCKGALDSFDVAIEHSIDPTLRRDRGICHEKLGHTFPAIDDYRAYIAAVPTAPDVEEIRARLAKLEGYTPPGEGEAPAQKTNKTLTEIERDRDKKDEAEGSPLRKGKGFVLGAFIDLRAVGKSYFQFGQRVGATVRASLDAHSTFMLEVGYAWNEADRPSGSGGPNVYLGYEARFSLDDYGTHSIFFGALLGYERFNVNVPAVALNGIAPRARAGYRLVLGPAFGIEAGVTGGPLIMWSEAGGSAEVLGSIGGGVGLLVGF